VIFGAGPRSVRTSLSGPVGSSGPCGPRGDPGRRVPRAARDPDLRQSQRPQQAVSSCGPPARIKRGAGVAQRRGGPSPRARGDVQRHHITARARRTVHPLGYPCAQGVAVQICKGGAASRSCRWPTVPASISVVTVVVVLVGVGMLEGRSVTSPAGESNPYTARSSAAGPGLQDVGTTWARTAGQQPAEPGPRVAAQSADLHEWHCLTARVRLEHWRDWSRNA
jgi:hypothetical protein